MTFGLQPQDEKERPNGVILSVSEESHIFLFKSKINRGVLSDLLP